MGTTRASGRIGLLLLGGLLLIIGMGLGAFGVFQFFTGLSNLPAPLLMPGEHTLQLTDPGQYLVAYESQSVINGQPFSGPVNAPPMRLEILGPDEEAIAKTPAQAEVNYETAQRSGTAMFYFDVAKPGDYTVRATHAGQAGGPAFALAILPNRLATLFGKFFLGLCGGVLLIVTGLIVVIVGIVRQVSGKRPADARPA